MPSLRACILTASVLFAAFRAEAASAVGPLRAPPPGDTVSVRVTGYCDCGRCCNWRRSWFGLGKPVVASGPQAGRPKRVGRTASGTRTRRGCVAADVRIFPFGTLLAVPGYGYARVEDTGGAIRGRHIDLWFPSHEQARRWGSRRLRVRRLPDLWTQLYRIPPDRFFLWQILVTVNLVNKRI